MKILSLSTPLSASDGRVESINFLLEVKGKQVQQSIAQGHPHFQRAAKAVEEFKLQRLANEALAEVLHGCTDLVSEVQSKISRIPNVLDGRMTMERGRLLVDGDPIDPSLEAYVLRMLREDGTPRDAANWRSFVKFLEKLYTNTSPYVREQLFGWLQYENTHREGFTIAADGDLIGYKGCGGTVEAPVSINTGTAVVNGVRHHGAIPNPLGAVVEMRKSEVEDNPSVGCAPGLHVGTYNYASQWARGVLLKVKFNPAYVVSVPTECDAQKVRVHRYEVLEVIEGPDNGLVHYDDEDTSQEGWSTAGSAHSTPAQSVKEKRKIFKAAMAKGLPVAYTYYSRDRLVVPQQLWTDEKTGVKKVEVLEDGQLKTFVFERMSNVRLGDPIPAPKPSKVKKNKKGKKGKKNGSKQKSAPEVLFECRECSYTSDEAGDTHTHWVKPEPEAESAPEEKPAEEKEQPAQEKAKDKMPDPFKLLTGTTGDPLIDDTVEFVTDVFKDFFKKF